MKVHKVEHFVDAKPGKTYKHVKGKDGKYYWEEVKNPKKGELGIVTKPKWQPTAVPVRVSKFSSNDPKVGDRTLVVTDEAMLELSMWSFAVGNSSELNGLGLVSVDDGNIVLERVFMCSKEATAGSVGLDEVKQASTIARIMAEGRSPRDLRLYWHFHTGGRKQSAFWSITDEEAIEDELDWSAGAEVINLVISGLPSMKARVDRMEEGKIISEGLSIKIGELYESYRGAAESVMGSTVVLGGATVSTISNSYRSWPSGVYVRGNPSDDRDWRREYQDWDIGDLYDGVEGEKLLDEDEDWSPEADYWFLERRICPDCIEDLSWDGYYYKCGSCSREWDVDLRPRPSGESEHTSVILYPGSSRLAEGASPV